MEIEDTSLNNQSVDDVEEDENKMSIGKKIDNLFARLETALKEHDADTSEKLLEESNVLIEKGGDWDRRNRNRVYEGIFYVSFKHEFVKAADLLSSCIGTFAVTSLMSYERFIFIASATGILCFDRNRMKKDILDNSDVIGSSTECRSVIEMGNALYKSEYSTFIKN
ncbi:Proteasome regulatory subunit [Entamoeba marina]